MALDGLNGITQFKTGSTIANGMQLSDVAVNKYKASIEGLSLSQAEAALSATALNEEQCKQILMSAGLITSTDSVTAAEVKQTVAENVLTTAKQQEVLATFEAEMAEGKMSLERLQAIALEDTEAGALARIILAKKGENAQNLKNIASGKALNTVLKEQLVLLLKNPLTWVVIATGAVIGLAKVVEELVVTEEELNEQIEELQSNWSELSSTIQSSAQSFQSLKKQADELIPRYAELAQGVDKYGKNVSLTDEEFSEFVSLNNQLGQMFPELVMGYDSNGNAILALSGNVDTLTESLYAFVEAQRIASAQTIADTMPEVMSNIDSTVEAYKAQIKMAEDSMADLEELYNTFKSDGFVEEWSSTGESMVSAVKILDKYGIDYSSEITGERNGIVGSTRYKITVDWDDFETSYNGVIAGYEKKVDDLGSKIEAKWKQLNPVVSAWLSTDFLYQDLDMSGQSLVTAMVGEIDFKELGLKTEEEIQNYITNSIISPIYDMDTKTQQAFFEVFDLHEALNKGELSVQEYQDKINAILENGTYSQEFTTIFKLAFAEGNLQEEYNKAIAKFGEDNKDTLTKFFTDNSINTTEEIEYWNKVTDGAQSATEAVEMYNEAKSTQNTVSIAKTLGETEIEAIETYQKNIETLSDSLANLNNLESSDITSLMTEFSAYESTFKHFGVTGVKGVGDLEGALESIARQMLRVTKDSVPQMTDAIEDMFSIIENPKGNVDELSAEVTELENILFRIQNNESLNSLETSKLINKYDGLSDAVIELEKGYSLEEDAIISLLNTRIKASNEETAIEIENIKARIAAREMEAYSLYSKGSTSVLSTDEQKRYANVLTELVKDNSELKKLEESLRESYNSDSGSANKQLFDWYQTYIERLQNKIDDLGNTVDNTYATWEERNEALQGQITETENIIEAQEKARDRYLAEANNIGLSSDWVNKIQSGAFDIDELSGVNDEKLIEQIQEYIEWYEKYLDMDDAAIENQHKLNDLYAQGYEFKRSLFDSTQSRLEAEKQRIQNQIDLNGGKGTAEQYKVLIDNESKLYQAIFDRLKIEQDILGTLKPNTDEYEEQLERIRECENGLAECERNTKDWQIAILNLPLDEVADTIKSLQDQLEATENKIGGIDSLVAGAVAYIQQEIDAQEEVKNGLQEQLDAMQEANDERERALALEKAKYELERAMNQRTVKTYTGEGKGFIYTQNQDDVRSAQENLDNLEYEEAVHQLEKQIEYYDDIIADLQKVQDSWNNIASKAQDLLDIQYALTVLGEDGIFDADRIEKFTEQYTKLLKTKANQEESIEGYEKLTEAFETSIKAFEDGEITYEACLDEMSETAVNFCETTGSDINTVMGLLAEANGTVEKIKTANKEASDSMKSEVENASDTVESEASDSAKEITRTLNTETGKQKIIMQKAASDVSSTFQGMCDSTVESTTATFETLGKTITEMAGSIQEQINAMVATAKDNIELLEELADKASELADEITETTKKATDSDNKSSSTGSSSGFASGGSSNITANFVKYHDGIENGLVGEKNAGNGIKEVSLRKLEPHEIPAILKVNEAVLNELQQKNVMSNFGMAYKAGVNSSLNNIPLANRNAQVNIGDINITCPGVTSQQVQKQIGQALQKEFGNMALDALQISGKRK